MSKDTFCFDNIINLKLVCHLDDLTCIYTGNCNSNNVIIKVKNKILPVSTTFEFYNPTLICNNDRFYKYSSEVKSEYDILVCYPAKEEDFKKCSQTRNKIFETPELYYNNTYPKIINQDLSWIDNIINGIKENELIIYGDDDMILIPDLKWDNKTMENMYYLIIFKDKNLRSIRDLNTLHLPLLNKAKEISINKIKELHNINATQLRLYFHYHPSFWQLHLHINLITTNWNGSCVDVAHLLSTVINNIKLVNDYYQKMDIEICIND
jgi:m7GpppX diphosphatase